MYIALGSYHGAENKRKLLDKKGEDVQPDESVTEEEGGVRKRRYSLSKILRRNIECTL